MNWCWEGRNKHILGNWRKGGKEMWEWRCDRQWTGCVVHVEAASETVGCLLEDESGKD